MSRLASPTRWATIVALLTASQVLRAEAPPAPTQSASAAASAAPIHGVCDEAAAAWASGASRRIGREIKAVACPVGLVRLEVAGAGCDFEVSRRPGFARTQDGAFGVSPIVNRDWATAPEAMKKGLADVLAALAQDPALPIRTTDAPPPAEQRLGGLGARPVIFVASGAAILAAGAVGFWWSRRRARGSVAPKADA